MNIQLSVCLRDSSKKASAPAWGLRSLRILPRLRGMAKQDIDWEQIELDYRAGIKTLRQIAATHDISVLRSEERRVGKECRSRWSPYH